MNCDKKGKAQRCIYQIGKMGLNVPRMKIYLEALGNKSIDVLLTNSRIVACPVVQPMFEYWCFKCKHRQSYSQKMSLSRQNLSALKPFTADAPSHNCYTRRCCQPSQVSTITQTPHNIGQAKFPNKHFRCANYQTHLTFFVLTAVFFSC